MSVHITARQMELTAALKSNAEEATAGLKKFVGSSTEFHWVLFLEGQEHVVDLRVSGPNMNFFAQAKSEDMYKTIELVTEKMEKQLIRNKEITKDHLHRSRD